jgi:hypothetical protein
MKRYRVEKESNSIIEILVYAESEDEALRIAKEDFELYEWDKFVPKDNYRILGEEPDATV